jgi:hypothetical protein
VTWHPLTWAFWIVTATGTLLYLSAGRQALEISLNWAPAAANADQLRRERRAEKAALLCRGALVCLATAALLGLTGITLVWHRTVPGAMCGTGVLQAMGANGTRAAMFWTTTLLILYGWRTLDRLDSHHPQGVLTPQASRMTILAAPFLTLALFYAWGALMRFDAAAPVSCCAAVYDQVLGGPSHSLSTAIVTACLWTSLAGSGVVAMAAMAVARSPVRVNGFIVLGAAFVWTVASMVAVKHVWAAAYYQVLSHPCPWCLFLPEYYGAGFLIFGSLAVVAMESVALVLADHTRRCHPPLATPAGRRSRRAARRIVIALIGFTLLTAGPAIVWRLRTGMWLHGTI